MRVLHQLFLVQIVRCCRQFETRQLPRSIVLDEIMNIQVRTMNVSRQVNSIFVGGYDALTCFWMIHRQHDDDTDCYDCIDDT